MANEPEPNKSEPTDKASPASGSDNAAAAFDGKESAARTATNMTPDALPPNAALAIGLIDHAPLVAALGGSPQESAAGIVGAAAAVAAQVMAMPMQGLGDRIRERLDGAVEFMEAEGRRRLNAAIVEFTPPASAGGGHLSVLDAIIGVIARHFPSDAATLRHALEKAAADAPAAKDTPA